jgi:hypothetical protein
MQYKPCAAVHDVLRRFVRSARDGELAGTQRLARLPALQARVHAKRQRRGDAERKTPLQRMQACRDALKRLDELGWNRSYHQRLFHDDFLVNLCVFGVHSALLPCT